MSAHFCSRQEKMQLYIKVTVNQLLNLISTEGWQVHGSTHIDILYLSYLNTIVCMSATLDGTYSTTYSKTCINILMESLISSASHIYTQQNKSAIDAGARENLSITEMPSSSKFSYLLQHMCSFKCQP